MKKLFYVFILLMIFPSSQAQVKDYGIRLGGTLSSIGGTVFNDNEDWGSFSQITSSNTSTVGKKTPLVSLMPTFFLRYNITNKIFVQPEIGISFNGFNQKNENISRLSTSNSDIKIRFTYLQVPLLVGYEIGESNIRPYVLAGFTPAFLVSNKVSAELITTIKINGEQQKEVSESSGGADKRFDLGFTLGGGLLGFPTIPRLGAEIRYTLGIINLVDADTSGLYSYAFTAYNNTLSVALHYRFNQ